MQQAFAKKIRQALATCDGQNWKSYDYFDDVLRISVKKKENPLMNYIH